MENLQVNTSPSTAGPQPKAPKGREGERPKLRLRWNPEIDNADDEDFGISYNFETGELEYERGGAESPAATSLRVVDSEAAEFLNVPMELRALPQWVGWKLVDDRKLPVRASHRGIMASSTKLETWSTFEEAAEGWRKALEDGENPDRGGIGFIFTEDDPYTGIDFDDCLSPDGSLADWAKPWIDTFQGAYTEISPSGSGVKVYTRGRLPGSGGNRKIDGRGRAGIEVYDRGRYFAVTGRLFGDLPADPLPDQQEAIDALYAWVKERPSGVGEGAAREPVQPSVPPPAVESAPPSRGLRLVDHGGKGASAEERAALYLDTIAPAISGQGGHNTTFRAAMIGPGFDLTPEATFQLLRERYNPRCQPPWTERDLRRKVDEAFKVEERRGWLLDAEPPNAFPNGEAARLDGRISTIAPPAPDLDAKLADVPRTDLGNAERMVARFGHDLRYCHAWGKWLVWDGRRYVVDDGGGVDRIAAMTVRAMLREAATIDDKGERKAHLAHQRASESKARIEAAIGLARSREGVPVRVEGMDGNPWLLNCPNGTIDLRTGELRPHDRSDLITQLCPTDYDPDAECPLWDSTLSLFFDGNQGLIDFLQRLFGYALTGVVRDHVLPIAYGNGANGKSTILGAMRDVLGGDHAMQADPSIFMSTHYERHSTEKMSLFRKRLVIASETQDGHHFNEARVKELTGGDSVRGRRMREDDWEFAPSHKIFMMTNHKPRVRGADKGIWRRLRLLPFLVSLPPEKQDPTIPERLKEEHSGILAWGVRGCLEWQRDGLREPSEVQEATAEYQANEDVLGAFMEENTMPYPNGEEKASVVFARYQRWMESRGEKPMTMTAFGTRLRERGIDFKRKSNGVHYLGFKLRDPNQATEGDWA